MNGVIRWGEIPVPYIALWSSEETEVIFRYDPLVKSLALFRTGGRGQGKPLFGFMCEERARAVVVKKLCQVCARPLRMGDCYAMDVVRGMVGNHPITSEPLVCGECGKYSLGHCPGIKKLSGDVRFMLARVWSYKVIVTELVPHEGGTKELNDAFAKYQPRTSVIGPCRPALVDYEPIDSL